jgi:hypothetical protein
MDDPAPSTALGDDQDSYLVLDEGLECLNRESLDSRGGQRTTTN